MGGYCSRPPDAGRAEAAGSRRWSTGSVRNNPAGIAGFAGATLGATKHQDRFQIVPDLVANTNILFCGIFDGHAEEGGVLAERASSWIPHVLRSRLKWLGEGGGAQELDEFDRQARLDLTQTFTDFQAVLADEYENQVAKPVEDMRLAMQASQGIDLPKLLPMKGGTTATTVVVAGNFLAVASVGDSRAVLCCLTDENSVSAIDLTHDHNVSNEAERTRAEAAGGVVVGSHIAVDEADGMVQVTRSLGDVPHHRNDIVTARPEVVAAELDNTQHAFVLVASDGVWACFSSSDVIRRTYSRLHLELAPHGRQAPHQLLETALLKACRAFEAEVVEFCAEQGSRRDDVVVCILAVQGFDFARVPQS